MVSPRRAPPNPPIFQADLPEQLHAAGVDAACPGQDGRDVHLLNQDERNAMALEEQAGGETDQAATDDQDGRMLLSGAGAAPLNLDLGLTHG